MNPRLLFCLALVLTGGLSGCSTVTKYQAAMSGVPAAGMYVSEIHMIDVRDGWAWSSGVEGSNLLLHTADGGQTWRDCTPRAFPYDTDGSCFLNSKTAWVSTLDRTNYHGGLLHTTDGGQSWSVSIETGAASYGCLTDSSGCHFFNASDGVANTADGSAGASWILYYETHDGGKNWRQIPIFSSGIMPQTNEPPGPVCVSDINPDSIGFCPPSNVVITHGDMGDEVPKNAVRLSVTTNLGKTWRDVNLSLPSEKYKAGLVSCDAPVFLDGKNGWLQAHISGVNTNETFAWTAMAFYTTHDGGETWQSRPGVIEGGTNQFGLTSVVSPKEMFVRCGANLYVTRDAAQSWQIIRPNIDFGLECGPRDAIRLDFVDATHGWIIISDDTQFSPDGNCSLYKTSDGGKTWAQLPLRIIR